MKLKNGEDWERDIDRPVSCRVSEAVDAGKIVRIFSLDTYGGMT